MRKIPKVIEEWIQDPVPDTELGKRILEELAGQKANLKWEEINIGRGELKSGARQSMEEGRKALVAMKARQIKDQHAKARKRMWGEARVARVIAVIVLFCRQVSGETAESGSWASLQHMVKE